MSEIITEAAREETNQALAIIEEAESVVVTTRQGCFEKDANLMDRNPTDRGMSSPANPHACCVSSGASRSYFLGAGCRIGRRAKALVLESGQPPSLVGECLPPARGDGSLLAFRLVPSGDGDVKGA